MENNLRVICIEDSEDDVILLKRNLIRGGFQPTLKQVATEEELRSALQSSEWDVAICDYLLPEFEASVALRIVREHDPDLPLIIVSGTISDEAAVSMMKSGAHDYIIKDNLSRLVPAIRREIQEAKTRKEKRLAEIALHDSEIRYRLLVESISDIIFVLDAKGYVTEYYSTTSLLPKTKPEEMLGKHINDIFDTGTAGVFLSLSNRVLYSKQTILFDYIGSVAGFRKWHSANLSPHEDGEHIVVILRDISDLKLAEEQLRASNYMANLYLDIMGHDIRNYLQAILMSADLLTQTEESPRNHHFIERITESVRRCEQVIKNVSLTAELPVTALTSQNLCMVVKDCIHDFQEKNPGMIVNLKCSVDTAIVNVDRFLTNLISNLLNNSITHGKGKTSEIWVEVGEKTRGYEVSVADDGPGIPDKLKKSLFDAERRFGGVGIHQAKQIVTKYGGRIDVQDRVPNESSNGVRFLIWLPQADTNV